MALYEYGELNQSHLMRICGLNNVKHKEILDDLVEKEFLEHIEDADENKTALKTKHQTNFEIKSLHTRNCRKCMHSDC